MSSGMHAIILYSNSFPFSPPLLHTLTLFLLLTPFPPLIPHMYFLTPLTPPLTSILSSYSPLSSFVAYKHKCFISRFHIGE